MKTNFGIVAIVVVVFRQYQQLLAMMYPAIQHDDGKQQEQLPIIKNLTGPITPEASLEQDSLEL